MPLPSVMQTTPSGSTPLHLTLPQSPGSVSGPSSCTTSCVTLPSPTIVPSGKPVCAQRKEFRESLIEVEGEVPVLNEDDDSWTLIRRGPLARDKSGGENSWTDILGVLTDKYFFFLKEETDPQGTTRRSHAERPIPLECLCLASFDDEPKDRKEEQGLFKRIATCFSSLPADTWHPFIIYHAASRIMRRYTLYTQSPTERNKWRTALEDAIAARKSQQELYGSQTVNDGFFQIPPRIQYTRGVHYTGRAICATEFSFRGEGYIAVGCTNGIYVSKRTTDSFRRVLDSNEPTSIAAIPESYAFLVHCESKLFSYRLDHIIGVSQGDAEPNQNDDWETRLAQDSGDILFFKAGRIADQTLKVVYSATSSKQVTSHVLLLTCQDQDPQYQPLGFPVPTLEDPHDATFLSNEVAICTSRAIYVVEPMNTTFTFREVVPKLPNPKRSTNAFWRVLKGSAKESDTLKILGSVESAHNTLVIYDEFGCFINKHGNPTGSQYCVPWDCKATTFALRGSHLLLFSSGFIEIRSLDTGSLIQVIKGDVRTLRCGLTEGGMLLAAANGGTMDDGSCTERLVKFVYRDQGN